MTTDREGLPLNPLSLLEQAPLLAPFIGVLVGVALGISPLAWPIAVVGVATGVVGSDNEQRPWQPIALLGAGITAVYVALGVGVASIDHLIREVLGATAGIGLTVLAVAAVISGVVLLAKPMAACQVRSRSPRGSSASTVTVGAILSAVTCPACAGIVTGVAVTAAAAWGAVSATLAMLGLGIGHTLALVGLTRLIRPALARPSRLLVAQRIAGGSLVLVGAFFAWQASGAGLTVAPTLP